MEKEQEKSVYIWTDGACIRNPGPGGWGALLRWGSVEKEIFGGVPNTTNNRMELAAVIHALEALKRPCQVVVTTDSQYVKRGITEWITRWKTNGWKATGGAVKNQDLWVHLDHLVEQHTIKWYWVKGHAGHVENERADRLAGRGARQILKEMTS